MEEGRFKIESLGIGSALVVGNVGSKSVKSRDEEIKGEEGEKEEEIREERRNIKSNLFVGRRGEGEG